MGGGSSQAPPASWGRGWGSILLNKLHTHIGYRGFRGFEVKSRNCIPNPPTHPHPPFFLILGALAQGVPWSKSHPCPCHTRSRAMAWVKPPGCLVGWSPWGATADKSEDKIYSPPSITPNCPHLPLITPNFPRSPTRDGGPAVVKRLAF